MIQETISPLHRALFQSTNPFYQHGEVKFFETHQGTRVIATNHPHYQIGDEHYVAFSSWSPADNLDVDLELFDQIIEWAKSRSATKIIGPMLFKTCFDYRLRLDHFDSEVFWGEPTNNLKPVSRLGQLGFEVEKLYFTDSIRDLPRILKIAERRLPPLVDGFNEFRFERFSAESWPRYSTEVLNLANQIFADNFAFMPVEAFDFNVLYNPHVLALIDPQTSFYIYNRRNEMVGFSFHLVDPSRPKRLLIKTTGILPNYRFGGRAFVASLWHIFQNSEKFDEIAFCLMAEDNQVHRLTKKWAQVSQQYGLFSKRI